MEPVAGVTSFSYRILLSRTLCIVFIFICALRCVELRGQCIEVRSLIPPCMEQVVRFHGRCF